MIDWSGVHSITVSWHEGMLTLAVIAVIVRLLTIVVPKVPVLGWLFSEDFIRKTARTSEIVAFIAALGGTLGIIASAVTGTLVSLPYGFLQSTMIQNKVMISIFAFVFWADFLIIRLKFGDARIWGNKILRLFYPLLAVIGFMFVTVGGSIGGTLAGKESIIEFVFEFFGVHKTDPWILPPILDISKSIVNSPLRDLLNPASALQFVIVLNAVVMALVLGYILLDRSKSKPKNSEKER